jgi:hypothetical protein
VQFLSQAGHSTGIEGVVLFGGVFCHELVGGGVLCGGGVYGGG